MDTYEVMFEHVSGNFAPVVHSIAAHTEEQAAHEGWHRLCKWGSGNKMSEWLILSVKAMEHDPEEYW